MAQPSNAWLREFAKFMSLANDPSLAKSLKAAAKETNEAAARLEKARGGVRKLEQVDKVLADAEAAYTKRVTEGAAEAARLRRVAEAETAKARAALREEAGRLAEKKDSLDKLRDVLMVEEQETNDAVLALDAREQAADDRDQGLSNRVSAIAAREKIATAREVEIKRFDDWRATAPA